MIRARAAVLRSAPTVFNADFSKRLRERRDNSILRPGRVHHDPQPGDVLHLAQPRLLSSQLLDRRLRGLQPRRRAGIDGLLYCLLDILQGRLVSADEMLECSPIVEGDWSQAIAESSTELVDLRHGERHVAILRRLGAVTGASE
jgi:hypothetical protein